MCDDGKMETNGGGSVTEIGGLSIMTWNINGLRSFQNFPEIVREELYQNNHFLLIWLSVPSNIKVKELF